MSALNNKLEVNMNYTEGEKGEETIAVYFKVLFQHPTGTKENHENYSVRIFYHSKSSNEVVTNVIPYDATCV
jgi:hypothetical protein